MRWPRRLRTLRGGTMLTALNWAAACVAVGLQTLADDTPRYYVSASAGDDANDGLSEAHPWKTVSKVNAAALIAGDVVAFRRGDSWEEKLIPPSSGAAGNPIVFRAYGTVGEAVIGKPVWARSLAASNQSHLVFHGLRFRPGVLCDGAKDVVFTYCILDGGGQESSCLATNAAEVTLLNCAVRGAPTKGVLSAGAGTSVAITNCVLMGNQNYAAASAAGGALRYDYNVICGNGYYPEVNVPSNAAIADGGHNILKQPPNVTAYHYGKSYFCITIDDRAALAYATNVAAALAPLGVKLTLFFNLGYVSSADRATASNLAARGNEVGVHGLSHSDLSATNAFFLYTQNTGATVVVDATNRQLLLACDTPSNNVSLSWSNSPQTISDLSSAIAGKGWSLTNAPYIFSGLRLSSLADSGGARSNFPFAAAINAGPPDYPYWRDEILESIGWITTNLGVRPTTVAYPNGRYTPQLRLYLRDIAALAGARTTAASEYQLQAISLYEAATVIGLSSDFTGGGSEAAIRANARSAFVFSQMRGVLYSLMLHSGDLTPQQVAWFADEVQKAGGRFYTFGQAVAAIRADHATADGLVFTETEPSLDNDRLRSPSVCADAGADLGLTRDYADRPVPVGGAPDVGVYEYDGPAVSNGPAAPVGRTTATLNAAVTAGGTATAYVCWGTTDGGMSLGAWSNAVCAGTQDGAFSASLLGLSAGGLYYYRACATNANGEAWASNTAAFVTSSDPQTRDLTVFTAFGGAEPAAGVHTYAVGTGVTCSATGSPTENGATQYACAGWSLAGQTDTNGWTSGDRTNMAMALTQDATLRWRWVTNYWLTAAASHGAVAPSNGWFLTATNVPVVVTPAAYYHLDSWSGTTDGCTTAGNTLDTPMTRPRTLAAQCAANLAAHDTPQWWLAAHGLTNREWDTEALDDKDDDRMAAWEEWAADTDPTNAESLLRIIGVQAVPEGARVRWQGGRDAVQYVQACRDLGATGGAAWVSIHTNADLPTAVTNAVTDTAATNGLFFYRLRARR